MNNLSEFHDETKADTMREANNEYFIASFAYEAEDALHIVREMTPTQRASIKTDLLLAADLDRRYSELLPDLYNIFIAK